MAGAVLTLSSEELDGDVPLVCVRTGNPAEGLSPVWFTRSPRLAWAPLAVLAVWAAVRTGWWPLTSGWAVAALVLPVLASQGVTGRIPLDGVTLRRLAAMRTRRMRLLVTALMLTWVAVALNLLGSRVASILVLGLVVGLYVLGIGMFVGARVLAVRGRPEPDGGATLRDVHPAFIDAVQLHRTGHRP